MPEMLTAPQRVANVRSLLEKSRAQIKSALPRHMSADRMLRIVMTSIQHNPKLLECEPVSLIGAVIQSSQLGLEPDGVMGQAYLIPYFNRRRGVHEVQFQPGYKGLLALARRSGEIGAVDVRARHAKDAFRHAFGLAPVLEHVPYDGDDEPGPITHVYAIVRLKDGTAMFDVMSRAQIDAHRRQYSRAGDDGPWITAWEEMAKKTVLKRVLKLAPASIEVQHAIALDERAEADVGQNLDVVALAAGVTPPPKSSPLDQLADKLTSPEPTPPPSDRPEPEPEAEPDAGPDAPPALDAERAARLKPIVDKLSGMSVRTVKLKLDAVGLTDLAQLETCDVATLHDLAKSLGV